MAASESRLRALNLPGFQVAQFDVTWDASAATQALANVDISSIAPKYVTPLMISWVTITDPSASPTGPVDVESVMDEANAQIDLSGSSNVNVAGAVTRCTILFPAGPDQDGSSLHGDDGTITGPVF